MENNTVRSEHKLQLKQQLQELGLPKLQQFIDYYDEVNIQQFTLPHWIEEDGSLTLVELNYIPDANNYSVLDSICASYRPPVEIEYKQVGSIHTKELDERMSTINWTYDHFTESLVEEEMKTEEGRRRLDHISETFRQLDQLNDNKLQGDKKTAQLLMYKHWTKGYYLRFVPGLLKLRKQYEYSQSVKVMDSDISISDMIEQLKAQHNSSLQKQPLIDEEVAEKTTTKQTRKRGQSL